MQGPYNLGLTRSISWLLMTWLLTSPGHQQPLYWLCRIGMSLSYARRNFKYLCLFLVWRNDIKCKYMFMLSLKNLARRVIKSRIEYALQAKQVKVRKYRNTNNVGLWIVRRCHLFKKTNHTITKKPRACGSPDLSVRLGTFGNGSYVMYVYTTLSVKLAVGCW